MNFARIFKVNDWNLETKKGIFIDMRNRRLPFYFFIFFSLFTFPAEAQKKLPVIAVCVLDSENVDEVTAKNIENLIISFLSEQKNFTIVDSHTTDLSQTGSDYICRSFLTSAEKSYTLTLTIEKSTENENPIEKKTVSRSYPTYNRILLESRAMIRELLDTNTKATADDAQTQDQIIPPPHQHKPLLNLTCLSGTWKADCGLERVVVMRTGKAVAIWKNGASMMLDLFIHNGMLVARQKGPSNPRYFADVPDVIASQLAKTADPIQWEMNLSEDEKILIGIKRDISIVHNGETVISLEKTTPTSTWTRE